MPSALHAHMDEVALTQNDTDGEQGAAGSLWRCARSRELLIQVDCGRGTCMRWSELEVSASMVDVVLITHLHSDHVSDLFDVLISRWLLAYDDDVEDADHYTPLLVIGARGVAAMVRSVLGSMAHDVRRRKEHSQKSFDLEVVVREFDIPAEKGLESFVVFEEVRCASTSDGGNDYALRRSTMA